MELLRDLLRFPHSPLPFMREDEPHADEIHGNERRRIESDPSNRWQSRTAEQTETGNADEDQPEPERRAWPWCARVLSGSGWTASMNERIIRLNMQLPRTSPTAMSGRAASAVAPKPVNSSGRLVVAASSTTPIQLRPRPDFSPSTSPYRASRTPAKTMTVAVARN